MGKNIELSIVIPVYNEVAILADSVLGLLDRIPAICASYEVILAENGSIDKTLAVARDLHRRYELVRYVHLAEPNYGRALKAGIQDAMGRYVLCDEIDLIDLDFYRMALDLLRRNKAQMVVGSKLATGSLDDRPYLRHLASVVLNAMLRYSVGFRGTDTHGLKAFVREPLLQVVDRCVVDKNLFASEFVIRAEQAGIDVTEVPVCVREKRMPTINLARRVPRALINLGRLIWELRFKS